MAYKSCIKRLRKAGHEVTLSDRRRIKQYMDEGLTDDQAITRLLAEASLDTLETVQQIQAEGIDVETAAGQLSEITDIRTAQLKSLMDQRTDMLSQIGNAQAEYNDLVQESEMFDKLLSQAIGDEVAFLDLTENEAKMMFGQLMMRATTTELPTGKPGQDPGRVWPEDRFRNAMEKDLLLISGRTPQEIYDSRVEHEDKLAAAKKKVNELQAAKAEIQAKIEGRFGPDTVVEPDILLQDRPVTPPGTARGDVDFENVLKILGQTMYDQYENFNQIATKEITQNAFDAIKDALEAGEITEGKLEIETSLVERTLTVRDNGIGMDLETLTGPFFTIAQSGKEGTRDTGGFGIAKVMFLYGSESVKVTTVRDGVEHSFMATSEELKASNKGEPIQIESREVPGQPNGTEITVKIPENYEKVVNGEVTQTYIPGPRADNVTEPLMHSPMLENVEVTVKEGDKDPEILKIGKHFDTSQHQSLGTLKFDWGEADLMVSREKRTEGHSSKNLHVLVNGLWQMDRSIKVNPRDVFSQHVPFEFYLNLRPTGAPTDPSYPLDMNRMGLRPEAAKDLSQLLLYMARVYGVDELIERTQSYGTIYQIQVNPDGQIEFTDGIDGRPDVPEVDRITFKFDPDAELEVRDGRLYQDGEALPELDPSDWDAIAVSTADLSLDPTLLDPTLPMVQAGVRNTKTNKLLLDELREEFGDDRVAEYFHRVTEVYTVLRDTIVELGDEAYYLMDEVRVGIAIDKALGNFDDDVNGANHGIHTQVPVAGMWINPFQTSADPRQVDALGRGRKHSGAMLTRMRAADMVTTMLHEMAHYTEKNHYESFQQQLEHLMQVALGDGSLDSVVARLGEALENYGDIYEYANERLWSRDYKNTGNSLESAGTSSNVYRPVPDERGEAVGERGRRPGEPAPDTGLPEPTGEPAGRRGVSRTGESPDSDTDAAPGSIPLSGDEVSRLSQTVFHGSPFTFDEFDMAQLGTGEGAQMYGWGLYFAEEPDVAKAYVPRDFDAEAVMLEKYQAAEQANDVVLMELWEDAMLHWTPDEIRAHYRENYADERKTLAKATAMANELEDILAEAEGQLYQVEINDEQAAMLLDWDAPLTEQPEPVQAALRTLIQRVAGAVPDGILAEMGFEEIGTGGSLYRSLSQDLGSDREASAELLSVGIPGHKFLDQQSRVSPITAGRTGFIGAARDLAQPATRNMVLFDTNMIEEVRRGGELVYSKPLAAEAEAQAAEQREVNLEQFMAGSHVVDENGDPLVVYHGTQTTEPFDVFDPEKGMSWGGWNAVGTWHSSERVHAERYSTYPPGDEREGQLFENYVSIKDPFEGTWEEITEAMQQVLEEAGTDQFTAGSGVVFRRHLQNLGYDGIIIRDFDGDGAPTQDLFVPFESEQIKSVEAEVFDPADPSILRQDQERGRITFNDARKGFIEILSSGDVSTFVHETGHLYLEVLRWAAQQPNAPEQLKRDWETTKKFTGATDDAISRQAHEKWANSFEVYAMEGKAPSIALQDAFSFMRAWMTRIYAKLKNVAGVHLNPEIRGVMDRLLASEEEIAIAEQSQGYIALFADAEIADMSQAEFDLYAAQVQREHDDNVGKEHRRLMAAMQRDELKWWKDQRKKIRAEVEEELHQDKGYIALYYLQRGTLPDGSPTRDQATKIDKKSLLALLNDDQETLNKLPRPYIYTLEGGTDVEVLARRLDFKNGLEMIEVLANLPRMKDAIESLTDVRMRRLFPDPLTDGTLPDNALRRVHSEGRLKILTKELRKLRQLAAQDRPAVRAAQQAERQRDRQAQQANKGQIPGRAEMAMIKAAAREVINNMPIGKIKPHIYLRGEQKAGREAFAALEKRDYQTAYAAKLRQIKNHEMYRAAMAVQKEMESTRKFVSRYNGPRKRRQLGLAKVLDQVDAVLENVDIKKRSMAEVKRKKALQDLKQAVLDGRMIVTPATQRKIMDESVHWTDFTPEEFRGLKNVLKQIEHGALNEDKMQVNDELVDYAEVKDELVDEIRTNNEEVKLRPGGVQTTKERGNSNIDQSIMTWLRPSSIARVLDKAGFGAITRRIIVPIRRAYAEKLIPMLHQAQKDVAEIYNKHYSLKELGQMSKRQYKINSLGGELYSKSELISMALNWGNQGNRDAVLGGTYKGRPVFTEQAVSEMLANLTAKDWAFVQDIWDYNETYWEDLAAAEERRRGIRPDKVEPLPFTIRTVDGQLVTVRGGYHPLRYDHQYDAREDRPKSKLKAEEAIDQALTHIANGTFVTANTRAGATYNRTKNHGRVVRLGLNIIDSHLREVIRDIAIGDEVRHVKRLLDDGSVERAFRDTGNGAAYEALGLWLTDAAVGELPAENAIEFGIAWIRTGFTKAKLGWNFAVMALQLTGLAQTIAVIGTRAFTTGFVKYLQNPAAATRHVMDQSSFLNTRYVVGGFDKDVQDTKAIVESEFGSMPTKTKRAYNIIANTLFQGIAYFQRIVDVVTWLGAYEKGLNEINQDKGGLSEQEAIIYADTQVEAAQTSGFFSDRSGLERGTTGLRKNRQSQLLRIWTTLISYMLAKSNIAYEKYKDTDFKDPKQVMDLLFDLIMLYTVEGILSALIYNRLPEDDDEPEEWAKWAAVQSLDSLSAGIPFVREIWSARFGGGNTPVGVFSNDAFRLIEQLSQGDLDWSTIDALGDVVGTAAHLPTGQMSKTGEKLWEEGLTTDEWWEYFTGPRD